MGPLRIAAAVLLTPALLGCASDERAGPLPGDGEVAPVSIDDADYDRWVSRERLRSCGEPEVVQRPDAAPLSERCLRAARDRNEGAEAVLRLTTVEGDPIWRYLRVLPDGGVETYTDATQDRFGGGAGWSQSRCADLTQALSGEC